MIQSMGRMLLMYYLFSYFACESYREVLGDLARSLTFGFPASWKGGNQSGSATPEKLPQKGGPKAFYPAWKFGVSTDLHVYLSEDEYLQSFDQLLWQEKGLVYGDWDERRNDVQIDVPEVLLLFSFENDVWVAKIPRS